MNQIFTFKPIQISGLALIQKEILPLAHEWIESADALPPLSATAFHIIHPVELQVFANLTSFLKSINLFDHVAYAAMSFVPPKNHDIINIHIDTLPTGVYPFALNIPIINTYNTVTKIYKYVSGDPQIKQDSMVTGISEKVKYKNFNNSELIEIDSYCLEESAVVLNTQTPHAIFNFNDTIRVGISIRFRVNPLDCIL